MGKFAVPSCYFPSTVVFVDDSRDFLLNFVLQLDEKLAYRLFDTPVSALEAINFHPCEVDKLKQRCLAGLSEATNCAIADPSVNLDLAAIHAEVYNPQRFSEVSVVVVDYAMPGMNGLEFCKRMEDSAVKKILLTEPADEKTAVKAVNEGLIHSYVLKQAPNVRELITESIYQLQKSYFRNMSDMVVEMLAVNSPNCLQDSKFACFFNQLRKDNHIIEFYLAENSGSFLMLDSDANVSGLIVKNAHDLQLHHDLALDNGASQEVLTALKRGEQIPCFWQEYGGYNEWTDWSTCLVPAKKVVCNETFYYSLVQNPLLFNIREDKVVSYNAYLQKADASEVVFV